MAARGAQKKANAVDEKKLQQAVESWLKKHRAKVQDQKLQSAVDDFVKSHRKEVNQRGMNIIRRVISEGRTKRAPLTASRSGPTTSSEKPIRAENRRGPSKSTAEKAIKTATDKSKSAIKTASRVGKLAKGMTGVGALLTASEVGAGSDVVPAGRRNEFVDKYKRGRGDGAAEVKARAEQKRKEDDVKRVKAATKARKADAERKTKESDVKRVKAATEANRSYKIKKGDTLSEIAQREGTTVKALAKKNNIEDPNKIYAGKTLKLNKGGYANCGASVKGTHKRK
jgi:LysM repeat protein